MAFVKNGYKNHGELVFMDGTEMIIREAVFKCVPNESSPWLVIDIYTDFGLIKAYRNVQWPKGYVRYSVEEPWDGYLFTYDDGEPFDVIDRWITGDVLRMHISDYLVELEDEAYSNYVATLLS